MHVYCTGSNWQWKASNLLTTSDEETLLAKKVHELHFFHACWFYNSVWSTYTATRLGKTKASSENTVLTNECRTFLPYYILISGSIERLELDEWLCMPIDHKVLIWQVHGSVGLHRWCFSLACVLPVANTMSPSLTINNHILYECLSVTLLLDFTWLAG